jgi:hypothetical protein
MKISEVEDLRTEGESGVEDLAKMARALGYKGACDQLQLNNGAFVSDIIALLEDNPGIVSAIYDFVIDHSGSYEGIEPEDPEEEDEDEKGDDDED